MGENPLYWEPKAHIHARGEALLTAQKAAHNAKAAGEQLRAADTQLAAVWKKTGLEGQPTDYRFDNATKTIVRAKDETQPETTTQ